MNLSVICDHLVFKGHNLKWRNTRSVLQFHSFRSHVLQNYNMCCIKSRHGVLESNFSLWYSTSTDHSRTRYKCFLVSSFIFAKIASHALLVEFRQVCWYFHLQWSLQCFSLACSAQRKRSLPIAIPSNQRICNNNFETKQGNWITKLRIPNVTIRNGNVDEIEKHPQIKSEFAFTI